MLNIVLSKSQNRELDALNNALSELESKYGETKKFKYEKRYRSLLMSESEFKEYKDKYTGKVIDLSISMPRFDEDDLSILDGLNTALGQIQTRRDMFTLELIRAIQNNALWKTMYNDAKDLENEMRGFWMTVDEIKKLKSRELRESEIDQRIKPIMRLRSKIEVYFREGKHRDQGEAMSYEQALRVMLENLDMKKDSVSRRFSVFGMKRGDKE